MISLIKVLLLNIVFRYEHANDDKSSLKSDPEGEKIHAGLLKKLNELESDLTFKMGNYCSSKLTLNCRSTFSNWLRWLHPSGGSFGLGESAVLSQVQPIRDTITALRGPFLTCGPIVTKRSGPGLSLNRKEA